MSTLLPNTLNDMILKVRRITGRPSPNQISDSDIVKYINTFYVYDFPETLRLQNLLVNFEFTTTANISVYDFPKETYLTNMPPVFIGGYQSYMTQSRENFFRINPELNFLQQDVAVSGTGSGPYTGFLTNLPIMPGFKPNPPGAYSTSVINTATDVPAKFLNWNVLFSGLGTANTISGIQPSISLIDDGQGNLFDPSDPSTDPSLARGSINYITGAFTLNFKSGIFNNGPINCQYIPYVASRPQSVVFFQDQFILYPVPDQAYTVSFECYKYPTAFLETPPNNTLPYASNPQLNEWWQCLAMGAALKIFEDNGDLESYAKFRPIYEQYLILSQRRTIVQQTSERVSSIYTEQSTYPGYGFGNLYSGF